MARPENNRPPHRLEFPPELPISARAQEITDTIRDHQVVILAGETGSGKTTQIPKLCLAADRGTAGRIACTQPRRVAALSISRRVADELGVEWGGMVGCKIRFDDRTSPDTVIKFMTDGMLLAEVQSDPMLRAYDTIILDEAHERSLNIDFLLGHLRNLRHRRPELKIVITSATIDTSAFSKAFDDAPIIEVSGRTYPVNVVYAPLDELGDDSAEGDERTARSEALHYIDGAVAAVERIVRDTDSGDILVFMPAERDIRETRELLDDLRLPRCETIPLFGRLSNSEQQRVFAGGQLRKIIVATNIAETSLTLPGIRYVVDTGLARVSRYAAQARTRRLPIEPVAQSSADQRKGRAGRVAEGVCIRLYSEKDYNERPRFAQPEIQRANLADVILRMTAFGLGDIERFPFINQPATKAVRAGYALLEELGALDPEGRAGTALPAASPAADRRGAESAPYQGPGAIRPLTAIGRELARLPVDPTVGRMILQARVEKCLREALVIAAGLSIQDPRERPLDAREKADAAHRRFAHADSDFLTLLNIWDTFHDELERLSQARLRRFCKDHFLSYTRMREWRDVHSQLVDVIKDRPGFKPTSIHDGVPPNQCGPDRLAFNTPGYRAIHRSILTGLLGNIAKRDDEKGGYLSTHDRRIAIFPGSVLHQREDRKKSSPTRGNDPLRKTDNKSPRWILAAEIMETSRLYARTVARLDPLWALDLGEHLLKRSHTEPFWDVDKGRVLVKQRTRLHGLEIESRAVSYGKIDPAHATEIFIREALVEDTITWPFGFLTHNREVRAELESQLTRTRDAGYLNLDEAIYRYYALHLRPHAPVAAVADLVDLAREQVSTRPDFLKMTPDELRPVDAPEPDAEAFPAALPLATSALPLNYAYKPGQDDDGVTLDLPVREAEQLDSAALDWAVPGHLAAKVEHYLRILPKELRRAFAPLNDTARALADGADRLSRLAGRKRSLVETLVELIRERNRVNIDPALWLAKPPPDHLRVRVRVHDDDGRELCAARDPAELAAKLAALRREASHAVAREDPAAWKKARARWEKSEQGEWVFGDIPEKIHVCDQAGVAVHAWPALQVTPAGVALRLFRTPELAAGSMSTGLSRLIELTLRHDLAWLEKDLRALRKVGPLAATLAPMNVLQDDAHRLLRDWICDPVRVAAPTAAAFAAAVDKAKVELRASVPKLTDLLEEIFTLRQSLLVHPHPYRGQGPDLAALLPADFLRRTPHARLAHLPRYLKAMKLRADRWRQNPAKDAERAAQIAPYVKAVPAVAEQPGGDHFRWLVEELRVSLFAQELGTAEAVSPVKLGKLLAELRGGGPAAPPTADTPAAEPPPKAITVAPTAKKTSLKSLNALDSLFRK
ncbi:MAG: ATP-dependent RNA helicase HrpA [Verrucomicrobiota bacterium]